MSNFLIYPSLLDGYQYLLNADADAANFDLDPTEVYAQREQALLDSINRKAFFSESAERGTAINDVVDYLLDRQLRVDTAIDDSNPLVIVAKRGDLTFKIDRGLVEHIADMMVNSTTQMRVAAPMQTKYGEVKLYGFADYIQLDRVIDLKTTNSYQFGKFADHWQKEVYPYCLVESGLVPCVREFEYLVAEVKESKRDGLIRGTIYRERYDYNHRETSDRMRYFLEQHFIPFLLSHRESITNLKIFGQCNIS